MASNARWAGWSMNRAAAVSLLALALAGCIPVSALAPSNVQARVVLTADAERMTVTAQAGETQVAAAYATRQAGATGTLDAAAVVERANAAAERQVEIAETRVALAERLQAIASTQTAAPPVATMTAVVLTRQATAAENDRAMSQLLRVVFGVLALAGATLAATGVWYVIGRLRADVDLRRARVSRELLIPAGPHLRTDTGDIVGLLPAPAGAPRPTAPEPANRAAAWRHAWAVSAGILADALGKLPPKLRQRDDLERLNIATADAWNRLMPVLTTLGAVERRRGCYAVVGGWDAARVEREIEAGADVLPEYSPTAPPRPPEIAPIVSAYGKTVETVATD